MSGHGILRLPRETLFGCGAIASLPAVVASFGRRVLVCTDPNIVAQPPVAEALAAIKERSDAVVVFDEVEPDLPIATIDRCVAEAQAAGIDVSVGIGGGSCLDAAKAAALLISHPGPLERYYGESAVPGPVVATVAVPTTAGTGSEVTPVAVVTDPGRRLKVGVSSPHLIPAAAVCDPDLTLSCPPSVTAFSGIDALAHAIEALTARSRAREWSSYPGEVFQGANVFTRDPALEAVAAIGGALERAVADGGDVEARSRMSLGSLLAGIAFGNAGTAGAHALQYPIGAATGTPHGLGVGLLLPYVLRHVREACVTELEDVAVALGVERSPESAIAEIARLNEAIGVPRSLAEIGVEERDLPGFAAEAAAITRLVANSPRPLDEDGLLSILGGAYRGLD